MKNKIYLNGKETYVYTQFICPQCKSNFLLNDKDIALVDNNIFCPFCKLSLKIIDEIGVADD
jgi:DNA-directed RNA polymerase subunit RPC12/RpoP